MFSTDLNGKIKMIKSNDYEYRVEFDILLELVRVTKSFKKKIAVDQLSFQVQKGDVLGLIGNNGAGKSTTISMIATLNKPDSGDILYEGESILKNPKIFRRKLGYVPQEIALYEMLSGNDNLKFWGRAYHLFDKKLQERIGQIKEFMGLTEEQLRDKVIHYSGGMKRRLNIGVALLHEPDLIIMDEPTVGIDVVSRNRILDMVLQLSKQGKTIIYTGHYMEEIERICNKICVMDFGKSVMFGKKEDLLGEEKLGLEAMLYSAASN